MNLIWWKNELKFFIGSVTSSIEVRQFFETNFIKILLSDYTVYRTFVWENFCRFWEIDYKMVLKYRLKFMLY